MQDNEEQKNEVKKPRKKYQRAPSVRMIKTAKLMVGKKGKSFRQAAKEAGYSATVIKNPAKVTRTRSWQELMDQYLPQDLIARKHEELLEAEHTNFFVIKGKIKKEVTPDHMARKAGIDMAHKLRGNYAPEKVELSKRKFQDMSNKELAEFIEASSKKLLKKKK